MPSSKRVQGEGISNEKWAEHFKNLLGGGEGGRSGGRVFNDGKEEGQERQWYNQDFDIIDTWKGLNALKNGKATGEDGIKGEFTKQIKAVNAAKLTSMINKIWEEDEEIPKISFLDVCYKLVTGMMVRKINKWIDVEGKLQESQAGFRPDRGTIDHIFVLNTIISKRLKAKGGKLYAAFM